VSAVEVLAPKNGDLWDEATATSGGSNALVIEKHTIQTSAITQEKEQLVSPISRNRPLFTLVAVLAVATVSAAGVYSWKEFHRPRSASAVIGATGSRAASRRSIAVLGFRNLSGRPEEAWLSTALAEMLSTELVAGEKLRLVSGEDIARTKLELPLADADSLSRETLARLHKNLNSEFIVLGS
jgi:eukaryotic-like serine/threonine-protein kinase